MIGKEVLVSLAECVLGVVNKQYRGFRWFVLKAGYFNGDIFNPEKIFTHKGDTSTRFFLLLAAVMDEKSFDTIWNDLGKSLWEYGNSEEIQVIIDQNTTNEKMKK